MKAKESSRNKVIFWLVIAALIVSGLVIGYGFLTSILESSGGTQDSGILVFLLLIGGAILAITASTVIPPVIAILVRIYVAIHPAKNPR